MIIRSVNLETVAGITSKLPENTLPEFAFAGRSNVGKSSLINGIMNRRNYARTSQQPGKTQTINYYNINNEFYLVDLPGYGFAKVPENVKRDWGRMVERYLTKSRMLETIFLLVDIRHEPSAGDKQMYEWIVDKGFAPVIIATKADKMKKSQREAAAGVIREGLGLAEEDILLTYSALSKEGRDGIYAYLDNVLDDQKNLELNNIE